ncbi:nucleoside hydrolase-like [Rhodnius prolixus]|uniref:IU_nuc_hydro domain-containing protein n=2 Tax=Rhodnius TaxID=13248 RepID=T1I715_RHOPR
MKMKRLIIVDNDSGVDDVWALYVLLSRPDIEILGITCVNGNTSVDNVCKNNLYFLSTIGRSQIPVFKGADSQLIPLEFIELSTDLKYFHGVNGFGDVALPDIPINARIRKENAIVALQRITSEYKGKVSLTCFGPLTNIALAIKTYPDFVENVKEIFIMGGNYTALGNTTRCAEFNFHSDPEAAFIVLSAMERKTVILPWEACLTPKLTFEFRNQLGQKGGPAMDLINKIEAPILSRMQRLNFTNWVSADTMLAAVVVEPRVIENKFSANATVELTGIYTRGQIVIDHLNTKRHNVTIIKSLRAGLFKELLSSIGSN